MESTRAIFVNGRDVYRVTRSPMGMFRNFFYYYFFDKGVSLFVSERDKP